MAKTTLKIKSSDGNWIPLSSIKGDKGDAFEYSDFTAEQLAALKGEKGDDGVTPTVSLSKANGKTTLTINDSTVEILDGTNGTGTGTSISIDDTLDASSENAIQNKAVKAALDTKADTSSLKTVATSGSYNDLTDKPTIPDEVTVDTALSATSENAVQNKAVKAALDNKFDSMDGVEGQVAVSDGNGGLKWSNNKMIRRNLTAGETTLVINDDDITTTSSLTFYTSIFGVNPTNVSVEDKKITLTFEAQSSDMEVGVKVDGATVDVIEPTSIIDDTTSATDKVYSSSKVDSKFNALGGIVKRSFTSAANGCTEGTVIAEPISIEAGSYIVHVESPYLLNDDTSKYLAIGIQLQSASGAKSLTSYKTISKGYCEIIHFMRVVVPVTVNIINYSSTISNIQFNDYSDGTVSIMKIG